MWQERQCAVLSIHGCGHWRGQAACRRGSGRQIATERRAGCPIVSLQQSALKRRTPPENHLILCT